MAHPGTPYGPNTPAVRRFLQRFAALAPADWAAAAAAYAGLDAAALSAADRDLARTFERSGRTTERDAVLGPLVQLVRADPADAASGFAAPGAGAAGDLTAAMHPVAEAALAAALALIVRDLLPVRAFAVLYRPFETLIPPATLDPPPGDPGVH